MKLVSYVLLSVAWIVLIGLTTAVEISSSAKASYPYPQVEKIPTEEDTSWEGWIVHRSNGKECLVVLPKKGGMAGPVPAVEC